MSPEEIRDFDDPLMGRLEKKSAKESPPAADKAESGGGSRKPLLVVSVVALAAVLSLGGYYLYDAQRNLAALSQSLDQSRQQLGAVSERLETSQGHLSALEEDLGRSQQELSSQGRELSKYQTLYRDLKSQQSEQGQELETITIRKADQAVVDQLADRTSGIEGQVGEIDSRVGRIDGNVADLREQSTQTRADLDQTRGTLEQVRERTEANGQEIAAVRNSLERDYYSFELQKNGSVIKVFDVALSLKDTDFGKQRFHVEILANGQRIRKKGHAINEPIFFYVDGKEKPYELLVNKVDKKFVTGHLSVPKT